MNAPDSCVTTANCISLKMKPEFDFPSSTPHFHRNLSSNRRNTIVKLARFSSSKSTIIHTEFGRNLFGFCLRYRIRFSTMLLNIEFRIFNMDTNQRNSLRWSEVNLKKEIARSSCIFFWLQVESWNHRAFGHINVFNVILYSNQKQ